VNYYERHIGDYLKDTAHLSLLEHGIYGRLLDIYYTREEPIPEAQVMRLVGARSDEERSAVRDVLNEFFERDGDFHRHSRCDREIERYREKQRKAAASAGARWSKRSEPDANAMRTHTERIPNAMPTQSEGNAPSNQTPDTTIAPKVHRGAAGSRLPDEWEPGDEGRKFALSLGFDGRRFSDEAAKFCDYWRAQPGVKGRKSDWPATWRNWCRNAGQQRGFAPAPASNDAADKTAEYLAQQEAHGKAIDSPETRALAAAALASLGVRRVASG
jgi:uncharacterized protein YdaU (DUF1376 family)